MKTIGHVATENHWQLAKIISIHRTYEQSKAFNRDIVIYRSGDTPVKGMLKIPKWIESLKKGDVIRSTYADVCDSILIQIAARGAIIQYANWHATGIDKNQSPQQIVDAYAHLDAAIFRTLKIQKDLAELRRLINQRDAIVDERKRAVQRIKATFRSMGKTKDCDYTEGEKKLLAIVGNIEGEIIEPGEKKSKVVNLLTFIEKQICAMAKKNRYCQLFNSAAHISEDSWITAASVVALCGGIERFDEVASFWHYCGEHVVDGKAPKRAVGQVVDWNPRLRTILWKLGDSITKNMKNPWRKFYDNTKAIELANHDAKCKSGPDGKACKYPEGHAGARAVRKMRKEIVKRWFLACKGIDYDKKHQWSGQRAHENKKSLAVAAD